MWGPSLGDNDARPRQILISMQFTSLTQSKTWALALTVLALTTACSDGPERPNVLLITLDTTRPDHMSVYGGDAKVPALERIVAEGVRFDRCVSTAGITPMSHASILSGLNNYNHGLRVFHSDRAGFRLPDEITTLPEQLKANGYQTAATVSSYPVSEFYRLNQGFDMFSTGGVTSGELDLSHQQKHDTSFDQGGITSTQRRGDLTVDEALGWLDEAAGEPWMLWVHMFDVHDTSVVPPQAFSAKRGVQYPPEGTHIKGDMGHVWRDRMYDPELEWMDLQIQRIIDQLEAQGEWDNTIVVVTADHGQGLLDGLERHGWGKHRLLYDWSIKVPLLIRAPGMPAGKQVSEQVRTIDVVPTVLELLDLGSSSDLDGSSLSGLWNGKSEAQARIAYADALNLLDDHSPKERNLPPNQYDNLFAACDKDWKYVWHQTKPEHSELYHLATDPGETENLYAEDHPEAQRLHAWLAERKPERVQAPGASGDGPSASALGALGYGGGDEDGEDVQENEPDSTTPKDKQ
jgi:arylsulfatase A-like enzyme